MTIKARIHSLNGGLDDVEIIYENGPNDVITLYHGVKYTAIFNVFTGCYYVDDIYGELYSSEDKE